MVLKGIIDAVNSFTFFHIRQLPSQRLASLSLLMISDDVTYDELSDAEEACDDDGQLLYNR